VYIALGANLGDRAGNIARAVRALADVSDGPVRCSRLWRTPPVGMGPNARDFANAVAALETRLAPAELLARLQAIEVSFGRSAEHARNTPRAIDLDIVLWGAREIRLPGLTVPHPRASQRRFVLRPLLDLDPGLVMPGTGVPVAALLAAAPPLAMTPWE